MSNPLSQTSNAFEFTYETKKLLWKSMNIAMRSELRTDFVNCLIDNVIPFNICTVLVVTEKSEITEQAFLATRFVLLHENRKSGDGEKEVCHFWEFFENRVVLKTRDSFFPFPSDPPEKEYNVSGSPQELMDQFLTFTLSRPGTKVENLGFQGWSDIETTDTLIVKRLVFICTDESNDCDLTVLDKIQKPLPHLRILYGEALTKLANYDLIQTAKVVSLDFVDSHRKLLMFKSPVIVIEKRFSVNGPLTHENEIFEWINGYAQQNRPIGHYFQMKVGRGYAECIIDILIKQYHGIGWKYKCIERRLCTTLLKNKLEVTVFFKHKNTFESLDVELVVKFMELGTAMNQETFKEPKHLLCEEMEAIVKYMDFNKKMEMSSLNPQYDDMLDLAGYFIDEMFIDCKTARTPTYLVDGLPVEKAEANRIFEWSSTIRHLHIRGVWVPELVRFYRVTVMNLTLETNKKYPIEFYQYFKAPDNRVGVLKAKHMKVLRYAGEFMNDYTLDIGNEESTSSCTIM